MMPFNASMVQDTHKLPHIPKPKQQRNLSIGDGTQLKVQSIHICHFKSLTSGFSSQGWCFKIVLVLKTRPADPDAQQVSACARLVASLKVVLFLFFLKNAYIGIRVAGGPR